MITSSTKKIFLLEDDQALGSLLSERLEKEGHFVKWSNNFKLASENLKQDSVWHLAILDVGLPDGSGFQFAEKINIIKPQIPILFLTAEGDADSRLKGYELGAAEYIPKPFLLKELLLRLNKVLKESSQENILKTKNCEIRGQELIVIDLQKGSQANLTHTEMKLLELLIRNSPKVIHRDEVIDQVWGADKELSPRTIDNMIVKLRTVLGSDGEQLKTVRGVGYQFLKD